MRISDWSSDVCSSDLAELPVNFTGKRRIATAVNGSVPAPVLRLREGDTVTLRVRNGLKEMSSIHWHGIIVPAEMDGVPGISFAGIAPGETFTYRFEVRQSGTYWYHAHPLAEQRSEEPRVGKGRVRTCRYRWRPN